MYKPSEECIEDFWTKGILSNLPVSSSNPNFVKAASQLRDSCKDKTICAKILVEDFFRLFDSNGLPLAPAYESLYEKNEQLNSDYHSDSVTEFYNAYGWKSKFKGKIVDDHLGIELLFLTILVDKYLLLDDEVCLIEMRKEIRRFIDLHILSWIPEWNNKIQIHSKSLCFKGIGTLILASSEDIFTLLDHQIPTSFSVEYLKN